MNEIGTELIWTHRCPYPYVHLLKLKIQQFKVNIHFEIPNNINLNYKKTHVTKFCYTKLWQDVYCYARMNLLEFTNLIWGKFAS